MNFGFPKNLTDLLLHLRICYGFYNTYLTKRITLSNQRKILFSADRLENRTQKKMCTRQRECEEMIHKISTTVVFLRYQKKMECLDFAHGTFIQFSNSKRSVFHAPFNSRIPTTTTTKNGTI